MGRPCQCCDDPLPPGGCPIFEYTLEGYYDDDTGPDFNTDWNAVGLDTPGPIVDVSNLPSDTIIINNNALPIGGGAKLNINFSTGLNELSWPPQNQIGQFGDRHYIRIIIKYLDPLNFMFLEIRYQPCSQTCDPCEKRRISSLAYRPLLQ